MQCEENLQINETNQNENNKRIDILKGSIEETKTYHNVILQEQLSHYSSLLKQGTDCREYGLSWLIKSLWLLDQEVSPLQFPEFLDRQAI